MPSFSVCTGTWDVELGYVLSFCAKPILPQLFVLFLKTLELEENLNQLINFADLAYEARIIKFYAVFQRLALHKSGSADLRSCVE